MVTGGTTGVTLVWKRRDVYNNPGVVVYAAPWSTTDTTLNDRWWETLWSRNEKNGYKHVKGVDIYIEKQGHE